MMGERRVVTMMQKWSIELGSAYSASTQLQKRR